MHTVTYGSENSSLPLLSLHHQRPSTSTADQHTVTQYSYEYEAPDLYKYEYEYDKGIH